MCCPVSVASLDHPPRCCGARPAHDACAHSRHASIPSDVHILLLQTCRLFQHLGNVSKARTLRIEEAAAVQPSAIALEEEPPVMTAAPAAVKSAAAANARLAVV